MQENVGSEFKIAGWCGVVAGVGLAVEAILWTASGWLPSTFHDPVAAVAFMSTGGAMLRWAVAAGLVNLAFLVVFTLGLSARLGMRTPMLANVTLWFGMIGITMHLLVPLSHWYGVPVFSSAAAHGTEAAQGAWTAFHIVGHEAAGGGGKMFMGLSMLTAGWAILIGRTMPVLLGWLGLLTGTATIITLLSPDTPFSSLALALFMPSLMLSIVYRIWAGIALMFSEKPAPPRPA